MRWDAERFTRGPTLRPSREELVEAYEEFSVPELAQWFGVNQSTIRRWLQFHDVALRTQAFLPFEAAREWVQHHDTPDSLPEWREWAKSANRPSFIPANPSRTYLNKGWEGWPNWFGRKPKSGRQPGDYLSFEEAREWVQVNTDVTTKDQYLEWAKSGSRPSFIPASPRGVYMNRGWLDWPDWLGTKYRRGGWLSFDDAREWVHENQVADSYEEWRKWAKTNDRPSFIPAAPSTVYAQQWQGWPDWLNLRPRTGRAVTKYFLPFEEARSWVQENVSAKSRSQWQAWLATGERPVFIPADPPRAYSGKGWAGWGDWLGTGTRSPKEISEAFWPFQEAREFVRSQGLLSVRDWKNWSKEERPPFIPAAPDRVYKDQWLGFTDWTEYPPTEEAIVPLPMRRAIKRRMREKPSAMLSYALAKKMIQRVADEQGWESFTDVYNWLRSPERPEYFPHTPQDFYGEWWKGWVDFVGPDLAPPSQTRGPGFVGGFGTGGGDLNETLPFYNGAYDFDIHEVSEDLDVAETLIETVREFGWPYNFFSFVGPFYAAVLKVYGIPGQIVAAQEAARLSEAAISSCGPEAVHDLIIEAKEDVLSYLPGSVPEILDHSLPWLNQELLSALARSSDVLPCALYGNAVYEAASLLQLSSRHERGKLVLPPMARVRPRRAWREVPRVRYEVQFVLSYLCFFFPDFAEFVLPAAVRYLETYHSDLLEIVERVEAGDYWPHIREEAILWLRIWAARVLRRLHYEKTSLNV